MGPGYEISIKKGGRRERKMTRHLGVSKSEDDGKPFVEKEDILRGDCILDGESLLRLALLQVRSL